MNRPIYLDYAAATPMDPRVYDAMRPFFTDTFYNPSSSYLVAKKVKQALHDARSSVAHWLGAKPSEIIFTAGATESINLAIHGVMQAWPDGELAVLAVEHDAVLRAASPYNNRIIRVGPDGTVDMGHLKKAITDSTVLVSIGYANNETGTIQPLHNIAAYLTEVRRNRRIAGNKRPIFLHTDASQAACYLDLHTSRLGADLMTLNGGKMYGPKQTGVLFVKGGIVLKPLIFGGGQEFGVRSGTENVPGIIGLACALTIAQTNRKEAGKRVMLLRDMLQKKLAQSDPIINGNVRRRLPNILHVSWPGIDGESLHMLLDEKGVMASTGSACAANKQTASHVLLAMGMSAPEVQGSLRLSLGQPTTEQDITEAAAHILGAIKALQK